MNKKKLTLLIALSIFFIFTLTNFLFVRVEKEQSVKQAQVITVEQKIEVEKPQLLTTAEILAEIKEGKWGTGEELINNLTAAGYIIKDLGLMPINPEYPIASHVWNAMKLKGWSDALCAGIMGNMMAECGGNTLHLKPETFGDSGTSFGLCQWHAGRKNALINKYGKSIEAQINFLEVELQKYPKILNSTKSHKEIAYDFCVQFERPTNKYSKGRYRRDLAEIAYNTFVSQ